MVQYEGVHFFSPKYFSPIGLLQWDLRVHSSSSRCYSSTTPMLEGHMPVLDICKAWEWDKFSELDKACQ